MFLGLTTLTFDPKINGFQDSLWNISMSSLGVEGQVWDHGWEVSQVLACPSYSLFLC